MPANQPNSGADDRLGNLVTDLADCARNLPNVDAAVKLRVLVARVLRSVKEGTDLTRAATELEAAASAALEDDPWVILHRVAAELKAAVVRGMGDASAAGGLS